MQGFSAEGLGGKGGDEMAGIEERSLPVAQGAEAAAKADGHRGEETRKQSAGTETKTGSLQGERGAWLVINPLSLIKLSLLTEAV
jgi:hypothetical protein